jgi:hypothetical protein
MYVTIKDYSLFQSVYSIKADLINKNKKLHNKSFYLKYKTNILEDNKTLFDYKIKKNDQVEIVFKSEGGTMSKGIKIFIWVLIFIIYFLFLMLGLMPFVAFIIPNIIVKGLSKFVNFLYELTHPNNFINSVLYFLKTYFIPFIDFIFGYFGLFIFVYVLTFFSIYHIYYYAKKENECAAYHSTRVVSLLTSVLSCIFYFFANSFSLLRIFASFVPNVIRRPFLNAANGIANLRLSIIGMVPFTGQTQVSMVQSLTSLFKGIGYMKLFGSQLLDNWDVAMELIKTDKARQFTQDQGIDEIINYIRIIEKAESHYKNGKPITNKNREDAKKMESIFACTSPSASAYFLRSVFHNILKMIIDMTFFIDICNTSGEGERIKEEMKENFRLMNELDLLTEEQRERKMKEFVEKIQSIRLDSIINIDCLINTVINGATFSGLYTFFFLIFFIVFFFVKL